MVLIKYSKNDIYQKAISEQWSGKGTSEDPFIIEPVHSFPQQSIIKDSSFFILVKHCTFKYLTLNRCKNVRFEGCVFDELGLVNCSEVIVKNCSFKIRLDLIKSHNSCIQDSVIPFLHFVMCYEIRFKTCTITQIANNFSRANIFENIDTPVRDFNNIKGVSPKKYYIRYMGFFGVGFISLISAITLFFDRYSDVINWSLIGGLFFMTIITFTSALTIFFNYRKMRHYPDNQVFKNSDEIVSANS
ncbi:hypothetical protein LCGC14_1583290 [marine sediment metagenome]|uniref:Pentapeptide repeat-containing protein n=1 Tax=marine sediment metagenome TaxID=412755 RepID=A0A0F9IG85_9ZZZZ